MVSSDISGDEETSQTNLISWDARVGPAAEDVVRVRSESTPSWFDRRMEGCSTTHIHKVWRPCLRRICCCVVGVAAVFLEDSYEE